ncbi:hypothetical protein C8R44DRAFT_730158 [Mycena epipterygia]|nr:hypothetical protein C8R44DRAFT_730158 [Mycena epipterygia]
MTVIGAEATVARTRSSELGSTAGREPDDSSRAGWFWNVMRDRNNGRWCGQAVLWSGWPLEAAAGLLMTIHTVIEHRETAVPFVVIRGDIYVVVIVVHLDLRVPLPSLGRMHAGGIGHSAFQVEQRSAATGRKRMEWRARRSEMSGGGGLRVRKKRSK